MSKTAANIKIRTQAETFKMIVTSQISMYVLLGAVVFVAPNLSDSLGGASIAKATTALLFVVGACFGLVQSIPILLNANAAADRIARLEAALEDALSRVEPRDSHGARSASTRSRCSNIVFRYLDKFSDTAFKIGPIDFTLERAASSSSSPAATARANRPSCGCCAGLYPPDSGEIYARRQCRINDAYARRISRR